MVLFKKILEIRSKAGILHFTRWAIIQTDYFGIFIHKISEADKDIHLHSHPWNFISIILKGSYLEESPKIEPWEHCPSSLTKFKRKKFLTISRMNRSHFHKVKEILQGPVFSFFITFGKHQPWYYAVDTQKIESNEYRTLKNSNQWNRKFYI